MRARCRLRRQFFICRLRRRASTTSNYNIMPRALPPFGCIKQNRRRSFAWRLTLASRRYAPKAPVRLRKAIPRTHISILISQIFAVLSKKADLISISLGNRCFNGAQVSLRAITDFITISCKKDGTQAALKNLFYLFRERIDRNSFSVSAHMISRRREVAP